MASCFFFYICLMFVFVRTSLAYCNLLKDSESEILYIDTESKDSIIAMCSRDTSTLSKWEQYQCEYIQNRNGVKTCWPQRRMSHCPPGNLKGAVFLYHGLSACPNYYNELAEPLQAECYHVYLPLIIGHGYNYCDNSIIDTSSCIEGRYNVTDLPKTRQPYIDYVNMMIQVINDEVSIIKQCELAANSIYQTDNIEVAVGGLSFGGTLSAATVILSGTHSVITKQMLFSPLFLASIRWLDATINNFLNSPFSEGLELLFNAFAGGMLDTNYNHLNTLSNMNTDSIYSSYVTFNVFLNDLLGEYLVEDTPDIPLLYDILDNIIVPFDSSVCEDAIKYYDRGGFCKFHIRHIGAVLSFSKYVMELVIVDDDDGHDYDDEVETLLILSERDEITWNSFVAEYVYYFYDDDGEILQNKSSNCMWLIAENCKVKEESDHDNRCGVPHSFFTKASNLAEPPYCLYWNETLTNGIIAWLNNEGKKQYHNGDNFMVPFDDWDGSRNQCVELDLSDPPKKLLSLNNLRKKLDEIDQINYDEMLSKMIDDELNKNIKYYIADFVDIFIIIKELNDDVLEFERDIIKSIKKNEDFRYWIWKLLDIKIDSIQSLSELLDMIYHKLSGKHLNDKILKFVHVFEEIEYWQRKLFKVDIDSIQSISEFLDIIVDELVDDDLKDKINDNEGVVDTLREIIHRIKDLDFMKMDDSETTENENQIQISMIITLSATNLVIIISFIVYCCSHQLRTYQYQK